MTDYFAIRQSSGPQNVLYGSQGIRYHFARYPWIHFCNGFFMFTFWIQGIFVKEYHISLMHVMYISCDRLNV